MFLGSGARGQVSLGFTSNLRKCGKCGDSIRKVRRNVRRKEGKVFRIKTINAIERRNSSRKTRPVIRVKFSPGKC